jgi:uroporphyrinogen-III decarboxylase
MYEKFIVPVIQEINRGRGTQAPTFLHHCGRGVHLFPVVKRSFGLTHIDMLTFPLVDIAKVRREVGHEVWINALIADEIVQLGPPERIRETVRDLMDSGAKGRGRLALNVGDMLKGTPFEHRIALYEAVKEFGAY